MTINKADLDAAVENADEKNEEIITEIIDSTPGLKVDDTLNSEEQFEHKSKDLEITFDLSNQLQDGLDNNLLLMKQNNQLINEKPIEQIPNDHLSNKKIEIKTEDIDIDDNCTDNFQFFPAPSTDDRKDFELKITGSDLIIYKSPLLTTVNVSREQLKVALNKILDDLKANIEEFQTQSGQKTNRKRIRKVKKIIENKLDSSSWLKELLDNQLKDDEYYLFGENFEEFEPIGNTLRTSRFDNRKNPYQNVTTRKRKKLMPIISEKRLKELPSIYTEITADQTTKIEAAKNVFDKIIKQVPPTLKKFKIEKNKQNNIYNITEI